ncbi:pre-mRNA-splicing factor ISY1 homolog isoform X1 [Vicugna pacos]|uniref:Pre-mRNA-splicing factor ISY1 homolog isoform X1 n=1 Tax=Vicugna pacos TaxID=30538 RepID=A0ABM5BNT3_VICPA
MARNAEKAMTALARFRQAQLEEGKVKERRPFLASECTELPKAEKWRRQIIGEISKKVAQIQNAGLGEFRIRDLNDEINKLLREKGHWEVRIKELGGPDYGKVGPKMLDHEGKEVPGNRGYKYFGAAKDLPGVRELFEKEPLPPPRKTRAELMKAIDFEYYGYLDEDDGVIVPLEQEYEKKLRAQLVEKWRAGREARLARGEEEEEEEEEEVNIYAVTEEERLTGSCRGVTERSCVLPQRPSAATSQFQDSIRTGKWTFCQSVWGSVSLPYMQIFAATFAVKIPSFSAAAPPANSHLCPISVILSF